MEKEIQVDYDKVEDILYVGKEERVKFSIDVALPSGDVVLDIGFDGMVKGIEIMNASDFFVSKGLDLSRVISGKLNIVYAPSYAAVSIVLVFEGAKQPIIGNVVVPYNKKLAISA